MIRPLAVLALAFVLLPGFARGAPDPCATPPPFLNGHDVVTVDTRTTWQPRGGQVLAVLRPPPGSPSWAGLVACFAWPGTSQPLHAPVFLHPPNEAGTIEVGIAVPDLPDAQGFLGRVGHPGRTMGLGLIPVAEMRLIGVDASGATVLDETRPMGVTSIKLALGVGLAVTGLGLAILFWLRPNRPRARPGAQPDWQAAPMFLLSAIRTRTGRAGLAQAQILLWSFVVCVSAAYVMTLTGTLVDIDDSTLQLLGIAAIAVLGARLQPAAFQPGDRPADAAQPPADPGPAADAVPRWPDLVMAVDGSGRVDVTRVQMLFFTLVSAVFVTVKVLATYQIPTIPANYVLLMGLSNGTYLLGRYASMRTAA